MTTAVVHVDAPMVQIEYETIIHHAVLCTHSLGCYDSLQIQ